MSIDTQTGRQTDKERKKNEGKLIKNDLCLTDSWVYSYLKVVYIRAAQSLKTGSLGSGPLLKMGGGGLSECPSLKNEGVLELKITKELYILKGGLLDQSMSEKWNKQMYIFDKGGLSMRSR